MVWTAGLISSPSYLHSLPHQVFSPSILSFSLLNSLFSSHFPHHSKSCEKNSMCSTRNWYIVYIYTKIPPIHVFLIIVQLCTGTHLDEKNTNKAQTGSIMITCNTQCKPSAHITWCYLSSNAGDLQFIMNKLYLHYS